MSTAFLTVISTFRSIFVSNRNNVICPKQLCCADQHLTQHTQAQFPIDRSGIRLNSKLIAQTVVPRAVIMWRDLVKRANPSYIFKKMKTWQNKIQPGCRATVTGSTCTWCQHVGRWRELGLLCACVGKIFRGPAESNIAECANCRFRPPFFSLSTSPNYYLVSFVSIWLSNFSPLRLFLVSLTLRKTLYLEGKLHGSSTPSGGSSLLIADSTETIRTKYDFHLDQDETKMIFIWTTLRAKGFCYKK